MLSTSLVLELVDPDTKLNVALHDEPSVGRVSQKVHSTDMVTVIHLTRDQRPHDALSPLRQ